MGGVLYELVIGLLRFSLVGVSTWLVHNGILNQAQVNQLIVGAAGLLVACLWLVARKFKVDAMVKTALDLPKGSTVEDLNLSLQERHGQ